MTHGVFRPLQLAPDRFSSLIYYWLMGRVSMGENPMTADELDFMLDAPLPGQAIARQTYDEDAEGEDFLAFQQAITGKG